MESIIKETKRLLNEHKCEEARKYIKKRAYYTFNQELDNIYISLFEPTTELKKELCSSLKDLQSKDISIRKKAVNYINKKSIGNWTDVNRDWLTDTRAIILLISAIEHEDDEKILLELINTIGSISQRYEYYDLRILNVLVPLYDNSSISIKVEACTKSIQFNDPRTWDAICKIFEKKTTKNTNASLGLFIARYANNVPKEVIDKLPSLIENAYLKEKIWMQRIIYYCA